MGCQTAKILLNARVCQAPSLHFSALPSHPLQPTGADGSTMEWTNPPHHMPPCSQSACPLSTPKTNRTKNLLQHFSGVLEAFFRCLASSSARYLSTFPMLVH